MQQSVLVANGASGQAGARNAAILAVQMMGLGNPEYLDKIAAFKKEQAEKVLAQSVVE